MIKYILYNPAAGAGRAGTEAHSLAEKYEGSRLVDTYEIPDYAAFFAALDKEDEIALVGGDGTLNFFANAVCGIEIKNKIYYHPFGTGNDFARDIGQSADGADACINEYLRELPRVTVNGESRVFINNVGFGIDGYCTERGDILREKYASRGKKRRVNYTAVAIGGLLYGYKKRNAVVTVDGESFEYRHVWLASATKGRYFGGGMMASPTQDRLETEGRVSLLAFQGLGKLHALVLFPSIFTGAHIKHEKYIKIHKGHRITVKFDRPTPLQIDGETIRNVTEYTVETAQCAKTHAEEAKICK